MSSPFNTKHRKRGAVERRKRRYLRANIENAEHDRKAQELEASRKAIDELFPKRKIILDTNSGRILTSNTKHKLNMGIKLPGGIKQ